MLKSNSGPSWGINRAVTASCNYEKKRTDDARVFSVAMRLIVVEEERALNICLNLGKTVNDFQFIRVLQFSFDDFYFVVRVVQVSSLSKPRSLFQIIIKLFSFGNCWTFGSVCRNVLCALLSWNQMRVLWSGWVLLYTCGEYFIWPTTLAFSLIPPVLFWGLPLLTKTYLCQ